jgi:aldehyde dehydrogenase (NAD+)
MTLQSPIGSARAEAHEVLSRLGVPEPLWTGGGRAVRSPVTGETIGEVHDASPTAVAKTIEAAHEAYLAWRSTPAPRRGELVRLLGEELRAAKADLARLVTLEAGKIVSEAAGEVQEMIDICDYATGLSRQLFGLTLATERSEHRMMETWHPIGVVGVISAFNFPVAVWSWNAALALVCGDAVVWKPSEKTPLTALAVQALLDRATAKFAKSWPEGAPKGLSAVVIGGREVGEALVDHPKVPLVSATGSTAMGRAVAPRLAARFARALLELGGNNAAIVAPSADLDLTLRGVAFAAMGTAGQRCTTLRRLFVHDSIYDAFLPRLKAAYGSVAVGDPRKAGTLVGPLIDAAAFEGQQRARRCARRRRQDHRRRTRPCRRLPGRGLCPPRARRNGGTGRRGSPRDLRADPLRDALFGSGRSHRPAERRTAGPVVLDLHQRPARGRAVHLGQGIRLRHRQRQHRPLGRGDRRGLRRREGNRRRPRGGLGFLEDLYAPRHQHGELRPHPAPGPGCRVRRVKPHPSNGGGGSEADGGGVGAVL